MLLLWLPLGKFAAPPKQKVRPPNMGMKGKGGGKGKAQAGRIFVLLAVPAEQCPHSVLEWHAYTVWTHMSVWREFSEFLSAFRQTAHARNDNNLFAG